MSCPLILAFDSSGAWCSAALVQGEKLLAAQHIDMSRGQGEALVPLLDDVMRAGGAELSELDAIGVGIGPGNFTGIRISVATARGLALGLGIPSIGVSRFDALAFEGPELPVVVPALRGKVWVRHGESAPEQTETPPAQAIGTSVEPRFPLAEAIARIASARCATPQPRPAPLYLRDADAAPPSEQPPALLE